MSHPDYGPEWLCWDGYFGRPKQPQRIHADDYEEAAATFARWLHEAGETYGVYLVGVAPSVGSQEYRVRVVPEQTVIFSVAQVEGGSPCAN